MGTAADPLPWHQQLAEEKGEDVSELYRGLADEQRRVVLSILDRSATPIPESRLARLVAARKTGRAPNSVAPADCDRTEISLHHVHLPQLEAAGLIERTDDDRIAHSGHPFWTTDDVRTLLTENDAPATTTATCDLLASRQRRAILQLLYDRQELTVDELVRALGGTSLSAPKRSNVAIQLVHCHIPKLTDANVVEVDSMGNRLCYAGNCILDELFADVRTQSGA